MKKKRIYKAHILYTKEPGPFEVIENGYVAVGADGRVTGVAAVLASVQRSTLNAQRLDSEEAEVTDFGDRLLIPAMNDLHVHAPQYRNQGIAMDLELLPWLQQYTFPRHFGWPPSRLAAFSARWEASSLAMSSTLSSSTTAT